ncbi:prepilin-type N-terminal cleavage/methylation domain-containing protein [Teredinibacter purpureus]|uniref:prepilin-type N-terminal cleavage/methylation domain-containing protein n=1 Tax=Teredinibacter purpureus TaxID=2731756 RepID=UPI0005F8218F|nr:prepilin-type N-terminal cleavage/methylation domain-containing protein [Teredinibacter purpureus]
MRLTTNIQFKLQRGFSLLELLVVLIIVGTVMGGVGVAINQGGPEKELAKVVSKFTAYAGHASDVAILSGKSLGLMIEPPEWQENPLDKGWRYRWQMMTQAGWQDYAELPAIDIPKGINLYVTIEGELWEWENAPEIRLPLVAFYPGGDLTLFDIEFTLDTFDLDISEHVTVDDWGRIVWTERAEMLAEIEEELGDL